MKSIIPISLILLICRFGYGQLSIQNSAIVHISEGANLEVGGNLRNDGIIQNNGSLSLYGDWTSNNNYNGLTGTLQFLGGSNQQVSPPQLVMKELIIEQGGEVNFGGLEYTILERLALNSGIIKTGNETRFILEPEVRVAGGSSFSYIDGTVISKGSGEKIFPLGSDRVYGKVSLLNVFGVDSEIAASFTRDTSTEPIPGDSLLGVSHRGLWELELINGSTDGTEVEIEFEEEDLSDLKINNPIRHRVNSPVIAISNEPNGIYESLGVESLLSSDSISFGIIRGERVLRPVLNDKLFLAIGLAPRIPSEGLYYIPEAFSPNAFDPKNQTFKIFGEHILEDGFNLQIYNRYGIIVYSTDSFEEANVNGWNGENQTTGAEEPAGVYYFTVKFQFQTGLFIQDKGAFYLVK